MRTLAVSAKLVAMRHRHWLLIVGAPLLLVVGYWLVIDNRSGTLDWIVLGAAVAVGLLGIWLAPWRTWIRLMAAIAYLPMMGVVLAATILGLECSTGNCL